MKLTRRQLGARLGAVVGGVVGGVVAATRTQKLVCTPRKRQEYCSIYRRMDTAVDKMNMKFARGPEVFALSDKDFDELEQWIMKTRQYVGALRNPPNLQCYGHIYYYGVLCLRPTDTYYPWAGLCKRANKSYAALVRTVDVDAHGGKYKIETVNV